MFACFLNNIKQSHYNNHLKQLLRENGIINRVRIYIRKRERVYQ